MPRILDAMTSNPNDPHRWFLDLQGGTVELLVDELYADDEVPDLAAEIEAEPSRFAEIPHAEGEYDLMARFAESVDEDDIRDRLEIALRGKGGFGRFRDVVFRYPDIKSRWFAMRNAMLVEQAKEWLAGLGIEPSYELPRQAEAAPAHEPRSREPKVGLLELLLLGAPDGKTELIRGRVRRIVRLTTQGFARQAFKELARQLCGWFGLEWRNRFIEGKSSFDLETAHLSVEGTTVTLEIEVSRAACDLFSSG